MSGPLDLAGITGLDTAVKNICTIEATCVTGFEPMAAEEVETTLGLRSTQTRGRVVFDIPVDRVGEVLRLRCINTVYVLIGHVGQFQYQGEELKEQLDNLANYVEKQLDWEKGLKVWRQVLGFKGPIYKHEKVTESSSNNAANGKDECNESPSAKLIHLSPSIDLGFRCTCYRSGPAEAHMFKSTDVQSHVGGRIQDKFSWSPKMKNYDLEFVINCDPEQLYCGLTLTNSSLGNRTITEFGHCTLRPTISACLVRLAQLQPGDVVLDPMCGTGSISLEGALGFPDTFHLGAEIQEKSVKSSRVNLEGVVGKHMLSSSPPMDVLRWDCLIPCLKDNSVDVIISDLPFGKRSGSKLDNRVLYPATLLSMARLVRPVTGRAVLLTQDKTTMFKTLNKMSQVSQFWTNYKNFSCNIGGLTAMVFVLLRTSRSP